MNKTFSTESRNILKELLSKCTPEQQLMFKKMYSNGNLRTSINDVVDNMEDDKIDKATVYFYFLYKIKT